MKNKFKSNITIETIIPDFIRDKNCDNIYRTKNYIVTQVLEFVENSMEDNCIISYDVFYKRTEERDEQYELMFEDKIRVDGKRLPSTLYTRKYVD